MPEYKLFKEISELSVAKDWKEAKKEWILDHIYDAKEAQTCLCGHYPIIEICVIKNIKNNEHALVGNCCVNRFFGIGANKMFVALKKVRDDITKSVNTSLLDLAYDRKYINDWEKEFYINILRKRKLSIKQKEKKVNINQKLLQKFDQESA